MIELIVTILISFAVCVVISPVLIPFLRRLKFGQQILEIGPNWHKSKAGTPTMGGIAFIISIIVSVLIMGTDLSGLIVLGFAFLCGIIGFADDFIKVCLKRNQGFNVKQKTMCLLGAIIIFVYILVHFKITDTSITIPFTDYKFNLGYFYYPVMVVGIFYTVNSVNLTDGIDGLATSITLIVGVAFLIITYVLRYAGLSIISSALVGGMAGFLIFNAHPAKVFMGDTGSLFLGGLVTAVAVAMGNPLLIIIAGLIYIIESLSVVIQVISFKLTGKRVFKMSPIHHHFEMCNYSENKIVLLFSLFTIVMCIIAVLGAVSLF